MLLNLERLRRGYLSQHPGKPEKTCLHWSKSTYNMIVGKCGLLFAQFGDYRAQVLMNPVIAWGNLFHDGVEHFWVPEKDTPKSKDAFVNILTRKAREIYLKNPDVSAETKWIFKDDQDIVFKGKWGEVRRILVRDPWSELRYGVGLLRKGGWMFAHRFWGTPQPIQERPFKSFWEDHCFVGRVDMLRPMQDNGRAAVVELKIGNPPPEHDVEATFNIFGAGQLVVQYPEIADQLHIPPALVDEIRQDALVAFDVFEQQYIALGGNNPVDHQPHRRTTAHWKKLHDEINWWEPRIVEATATGNFPDNGRGVHCRHCDVGQFCARAVRAHVETFSEPVPILSGIPVPVPRQKRRGAGGVVYFFNIRKDGSMGRKALIISRKGRHRLGEGYKDPRKSTGGA